MQGQNRAIKNILNTGSIYVIPPYQRLYQWGPELWHNLVHDVLLAQTNKDTDPAHWLGIFLFSSGEHLRFPDDDSVDSYTVIDGQQRLVTLYIWLSALVHHAEDIKKPINLKLDRLCQIIPQEADKKAFEIIKDKEWQNNAYENLHESYIFRAYYYFRFALWLGQDALLDEHTLKVPKPNFAIPVFEYWEKFLQSKSAKGLVKSNPINAQELVDATRNNLSAYTLIHERTDEPQAVIFDTLNGNRYPLEPLDHVRNSLFVKLSQKQAKLIYTEYWEKAEQTLLNTRLNKQKPAVNFLYDYVIAKGEKKNQGTINKNKGAGHFNKMTRDLKDEALAKFIKDDLTVAMSIWPIAIGKQTKAFIQGRETNYSAQTLNLIDSIRELSSGPFNPLILNYLTAKFHGAIENQELEENLFLIENYLVRQLLMLTPLSPLRARVMDIAGALQGKIENVYLQENLKKTWKSDKEILKGIEKRTLYGELKPAALASIFRGIEIKLSGSGANRFKFAKNEYTIEHIYPVKSSRWVNDLENWKSNPERMMTYVNTLGNLTVVTQEHNSTVGNKPLKSKQDHPTQIGVSAPLRIHDDWLKAKRWTELEIQERTKRLAEYALNYWKDLS